MFNSVVTVGSMCLVLWQKCVTKDHMTHFWDNGHLEMVLFIKVRGPILIPLKSQSKEFGYYPIV